VPGRRLTKKEREENKEAWFLEGAYSDPDLENRISAISDYIRSSLQSLPSKIGKSLVDDIVEHTVKMTKRAVRLAREEDAV
jgi:hypothetical protein